MRGRLDIVLAGVRGWTIEPAETDIRMIGATVLGVDRLVSDAGGEIFALRVNVYGGDPREPLQSGDPERDMLVYWERPTKRMTVVPLRGSVAAKEEQMPNGHMQGCVCVECAAAATQMSVEQALANQQATLEKNATGAQLAVPSTLPIDQMVAQLNLRVIALERKAGGGVAQVPQATLPWAAPAVPSPSPVGVVVGRLVRALRGQGMTDEQIAAVLESQ